MIIWLTGINLPLQLTLPFWLFQGLFSLNLNLDFFKYEDYEEYNEDFFITNFETNDTQFLKEVQDTYLQKIPYVSSNYAIYFDQTVKDALSNWKL